MGAIKNLFWNKEEARLRAGWRILVAFIVWLTLLFAVLGLRDAVLAKRLAELYTETVTTAIHALLVLVVFLWLVGSRLLDRRPLADYGFHLNKEWWLDLGFGLALASLLLAGIFVVERAMGWIKITGAFVPTEPDQSFVLSIVISLIGIPLGAIQEEVTWRGYILRNLAEGFNWKIIGPRWALIIAVVITSVWFGWSHISNPNATMFSALNTILVTLLVLSTGYALTGELALPIGFHMAWNFVQVCVFGFPGGKPLLGATFIAFEQSGPVAWTGGAYGPEGGWLGTVAFILGFLLIAVWVGFKHGGIRLRPLIAQPATQPTVSALR